MVQLEYQLIENDFNYQEDRRSIEGQVVSWVAPACLFDPICLAIVKLIAARLIDIRVIRMTKLYEVAGHVSFLIRKMVLHWGAEDKSHCHGVGDQSKSPVLSSILLRQLDISVPTLTEATIIGQTLLLLSLHLE